MATLTDDQIAVIQLAIDAKVNSIKLYSEQLNVDAKHPRGNYSIDGESVDRDRWRKSLLEMIKGLQDAIIADQKLINRTPSFAWLGKTESESLDYDQRNGRP